MQQPTLPVRPLDLAIIGGGPAGMSGALVAGRARLSTVVVNAESPRNRVTKASHGFLTRDGVHPLELLRLAKEQLTPYPSVTYRADRVRSVERSEDGFSIHLESGDRLIARRVLLATGYVDDLDQLGIPDLGAVYGTSVFPCPFCDGYEHRDERLALFGAAAVAHMTPMLKVWSDDVAVFTHGRSLDAELAEALAARDVPVHTAAIVALHHDDGVLRGVELETGEVVPRDAGFLAEILGVPATPFADDLGVGTKTSPWGFEAPDADEHGRTNVDGVYVVGDARTGFSGLMHAASEGGGCVEHIVHELASERWRI